MPTLSEVRQALYAANGRKLTARQITAAIGRDPGSSTLPSGAMKDVIRILYSLQETGEIGCEMPNAACTEIAYYTNPARASAHV